jgi:23S rRNA pseudouridine1911/1915/1917 synthase
MLSTHFQGRHETLDRAVKAYLKQRYHKPGNVFLGVVHRLDRAVSGVLLFARTSKAAGRLASQFRNATVHKLYWGVVEGTPFASSGQLHDWLLRDDAGARMRVVLPGTPTAKAALLEYASRATQGGFSWLELRPRTGRKHQIRVQLAKLGHPLLGDFRYGSRIAFGGAIALHARSLTFIHPVRNQPVTVSMSVPETWLSRLGNLFPGIAGD